MSAVQNIRPESFAPLSQMPAGLDACEQLAYRKGNGRALLAYVKKHGGPAVTSDKATPAPGTPERVQLAERVREASAAWYAEHGAARDLAAHKAGMSGLRAYWKRHGIADKFGPVKAVRKPAARKLAAVPVPDPVPVEKPADVKFADVIARRSENKVRNRELAAEMREAGIPITVETWNAAKSGQLAGIGGAA